MLCFSYVVLFPTIVLQKSGMRKIYSLLFSFSLALSSFSQNADVERASYYMFRNSDSAFYFSNKVISEAKNPTTKYYGKFLLGQCIFWEGQIDSSLSYYNSVEDYFRSAKDSFMLMKIYCEKGNALKVISQYDKSYDYLMRAFNIAQSMDSLSWLAIVNINLQNMPARWEIRQTRFYLSAARLTLATSAR